MMKAWISLEASTNCPGLRLDLRFDGVFLKNMVLTEEVQRLHHEFDDFAAAHRLEIELSNKLPPLAGKHQADPPIEDAVAVIKNVSISGIELGQIFYGQSMYFHDYNGSSNPTVGQFYENMGCNGTVRFDFASPVYAWLIENL
jgi:hypothetical protein